jgi:hypothetical protein
MRCVLVLVLGALATAGCSRSACVNEAFYGLPSPDGKNIAFIFHRTCTTPAALTTEVSLMPFHDSLRGDAGNVLSVAGERAVKVSWHGPTILWVTGSQGATYQRPWPIDGVTIEFH